MNTPLNGPASGLKRYRMSDKFMLRTIAGESVLIPLGSDTGAAGEIGLPNESFCFVLSLFAQPRTAQEAVALAQEEYDDPDGTMEQDILGCIQGACKMGILIEEEE